MRHVSLHNTIDTPSHTPAHTRLLEHTPRYNILEVEDVISIVGSSCTSWRRSISIIRRAGAPDIGESDSVEYSWSIIQESKELRLGMCYRGHCPYIWPSCYEIQAWSLGWNPYILRCNQVQMINRSRAVKWLTVVQQPIRKFDKYTVYEYIVIISEHQSTNFLSPVVFNLYTEWLFKVGNFEIYWYISESG